ncbi:unnamed protein product [Ixodes hexagonus]
MAPVAETDVPERDATFEDLHLKKWIIDQLNSLGIKKPSAVQQNCIPSILKGKDCIGCAKTGSGKTLAFALPILQKLFEDPYGIFALVLTPTRELAFQISEQFKVIGKGVGLKDCVIVGGMDMVTQGRLLAESPHVVVSTPGRLADHLESCNTFTLGRIKFLVLDEADRLLEGHFNDQYEALMATVPVEVDASVISAAYKRTNTVLMTLIMMPPLPSDGLVHAAFSYRVLLLGPKNYLLKLPNNETKIPVFTQFVPKIAIHSPDCGSCQVLSMGLKSLGFANAALHSQLPQRERLAALASFKSNTTRVLVATDVASRGLDIPCVEMVLNHNVPSVPKDYVHRVGRTARAGRGGMALTLVTQHDVNLLRAIEDLINTKLSLHPTKESEVLKILTQVSVALREAEIRLDEQDFDERKLINRRKKLLLQGLDPDEVERKRQQRQQRKLRRAKQRHKGAKAARERLGAQAREGKHPT